MTRIAAHAKRPGAGHGGFTLVELMVAVSITAVLVVSIGRIFDTVGESIAVGRATSEILRNSRIVGDQIERDFEHVIGPAEGGFLVIAHQQVPQVRLHEQGADPNDPNVPGALFNRRSDQVLFIRRRADAEPIVPGKTNSYNSASDASYIRVWYGHGRRTNTDGRPAAENGLGEPDTPNEYAGDWILARHALYLDPTSPGLSKVGTPFPDEEASNGLGWPHSGQPNLYRGLCAGASLSLKSGNSLVDRLKPSPLPGSNYTLYENMTAEEYIGVAREQLFMRNGTGQNYRLQVNPRPAIDPNDPSFLYAAWQVAQMHPYLAGHISDFQVDFAGDFDDDDDLIDRDGGNNIIWYGRDNALPDGSFAASDSTDPNDIGLPVYEDNPAAEADRVYVFRHGKSDQTNWPRLIRIRYRLHDARYLTTGPDERPGRSFEQIMRVVHD